MPRSSRHKSSKHSSSREVRDYSDSEKDHVLKEKKGRDDGGSSSTNRHAKESAASGEKCKLESKSIDIVKESVGIVNVVGYTDRYGGSSSLKKRKDKVDDDRWTGGDNEHELSKSEVKETKPSSDYRRSSRRDVSATAPGFDREEVKKSGSKVETKSHRSDRKERSEKEGASEGEKKVSKSESLVVDVVETDNIGNEGSRKLGSSFVEERVRKSATDVNISGDVLNSEPERELDRRVRRKKDGLSDGDKHQDGVRELDDKRLSSKEDVSKSRKFIDDGHKEERIRDKYREDVDKEHLHPDERQSDIRRSRDYSRGRSGDKHLRNEKDMDMSQKKSKPHGSEYDRDRDRDHDRDRDRDRDHDHDRNMDRDRARDGGHHDREQDREQDDRDRDLVRERDRDVERTHERDRELDWDRERGRDRYRRERERDRIRDRDHTHDRSRDRDYDHDQDYGSHIDDKSSRYKEDRGRRRSPDGYDDYHGDKSRRVESEVDRERSLSRKAQVDSVTSGSRRRASPSSRSYVSTDKFRDGIPDDIKYGESLKDGETNKVPKFRSGEKRGKFDDNHIGELPERSPGAKVSPVVLKEISPSSTVVDRRFSTGRRGSLDLDEAERRSMGSNDMRDVSVNDDRQGRDFSAKKSIGEEYPRAEISFHHKSGQGNASSHGPSPSGFRAGADSPSFMGSLGDDSRGHSGNRYRRSVDPHVGRGPGNAWKGIPNWPSPLPNGFMPFMPGPHHGGFPPMLSQFPPLFGVRPPMEMNHHGIPYHMGDADRFSGHVRPMGWQNMVDGSVPPHFHGWDANNGVLRDESSMYGHGHLSNVRGRDINEEMWKPNGNMNADATSGSQKDASNVKVSADEASSALGTPRPHQKSSSLDDQGMSVKMNTSSGPSSPKEIAMTQAKVTTEKTPESSSSVDDSAQYLRAYLAKLDISMDMADPELYNQYVYISVKDETECVEDEVKLEPTKGKVVAETEFTSLTVGSTIFPAAKDSIFQRALDLYKTQSNERTTAKICKVENVHSLSPSEPDVEQTVVPILTESEDSEQQASDIVELVPPEGILETMPKTNKEALNEVQVANPTLDIGNDEADIPVLDVEKLEENICENLNPQNDGSTYFETIASSVEVDIDGKIGGIEPSSGEQLDVKVSEPLILSNDSESDSVKICEVVSNDSSRIHGAPESTH